MKVGFVTFGCRLNRAEALDMEAQYAAAGWEVVPAERSTNPKIKRSNTLNSNTQTLLTQTLKNPNTPSPDLIIVRGCSVTARAQRDCEKEIAHLRAQFPHAEIHITGCLDIRSPAHSAPLHSLVREANHLPSNSNNTTTKQPDNPILHSLVREANPSPNQSNNLTIKQSNNLPLPLRLSRAYLKVQDGCSGRCSFCIVPSFRGAPVSVPFADVLARARAYIDAGFRELVLTGCNLCLYHDSGRGLPELAAAIAALESLGHRVRLGSIEPGICDTRLLDALESHPNICRSLHLSLQSGSDRILRLMRRPYTTEQIATFCAEARRRLGPRLALGADIITGFPGETDGDHEATRSFLGPPPPPSTKASNTTPNQSNNLTIKQSNNLTMPPFIHLHVFPYSERPGTEAAAMKPAVPVAVRRARAKELERIGTANRAAFAHTLIGQEVTVCVEKDGNGRSDEYFRCLLKGTAPRRSLVRATVEDYFPKTGTLSATIRTKD